MLPLHRFRNCFRLAVLISAALFTVVGARSEVLTSFWQAALSDQKLEGWRFAWNPAGPLEQVEGYSDLVMVESTTALGRRHIQRGVLDGDGALRADAPSLSSHGQVSTPSSPADGPKRYLIASYTMTRDSRGAVWINDGNLQNKNVPAGTELKIFLNGVLQNELVAGLDLTPVLFQQSLGPLKKGDTVSVAIGPAKSGERGGGSIRYTLEEWPDGQSAPPPQNTTRIPIDGAGPQFGSDGTSAAYEAKQTDLKDNLLARQPELVFIGDSITTRWPQEMLEENFGAYRPVILGVGGDSVQNVIWRLQQTPLEAVPLKAAVLLIGTNNIPGGFTPDEIAGGIEKLAKMIQEKAPEAKILLLGVLPRGPSIQGPENAKVLLLNAKIQALADDKRVFYLDVGPSLAEPDGSISPEVTPDRLHVAMPGFIRWMAAMKPTLERLLPQPGSSPLPTQKLTSPESTPGT
jgi:beta-glucosidase